MTTRDHQSPPAIDAAPAEGEGRSAPPFRYGAALAGRIERKWQDRWEQGGLFRAPSPGAPAFEAVRDRVKKYILDMFPYPSGAGLHVGHPLGYIATDIYARFLRMTGHNVLHAMGYDAFGLPAEQYAVQTGQHPRVTTEVNIATMRRQLRRLGLAHDDRRSVATTDVAFYRWTQWIFLQIYNAWYDERADRARPIAELIHELERGLVEPAHPEHNPTGRPWRELSESARRAIVDSRRLAYLDESPVNWCPALGTVLANEEVTAEGRSERGDHPVFKRPMRQWKMRITAYAHRLLADLDALDWPDAIKLQQRNWIGRSEGARIRFPVEGLAEPIEVFTTRPDTIFGATYMVLAPEHPLVDRLTPRAWPAGTPAPWKGGAPDPRGAVAAYRAAAAPRSDVQRQAEGKDKTGVFTGAFATNPASGERIPVFVADYVMMGYGSGAIMAVPAHDERDFDFATQFGLPMRDVVYSTIAMRTRAFTQFVKDSAVFAEGWLVALADFIGLATSLDAPPERHRELIERVRAGDVESLLADAAAPEGPGGPPRSKRDALREVWLDTLAYLREIPYETLGASFREGQYRRLRGSAHTTIGWVVNSPPVEGMRTADAKPAMTDWLEKRRLGESAVTYKLRDWLFSRQRYWGEPFPIVYDAAGAAHALPESMLPVTLPEMENFQPEPCDENDPTCAVVPRPPLARATQWTAVTLDLGHGPQRYTRELNTMPQWAGSCWYYLRYLDPQNEARFCDPAIEKHWMNPRYGGGRVLPGGVDLYVGGVEHAVLHLLYARFWHKALFDLGHVSGPEPFQRLFNQGYIQAWAYRDSRGVYVDAERVEEDPEDPHRFLFEGRIVSREYGKMGKSLKNAVAPDDICDAFGADTLRLYEMYLGPLEQAKPWSTRDIIGVHRFLQRVWRACIDEETGRARVTDAAPDAPTRRLLHRTIAGVREDMAHLRFNTAIAKLIELNNHVTRLEATPREVAQTVALMLAPLAPHFAEELWSALGHAESLAFAPFPQADPALLVENEVEIPVQVNGKLRGRIRVAAGADQAAVETAALADEKVRPFVEGRTVRKIISIPGRLVNILVE